MTMPVKMKRLIFCLLMVLAALPSSAAPARSIRVEVRGHGAQPLVLIPCAGCDWRSWEPFMARNRRRYTMHAVTLPGLGGVPRWPVATDAEGTPLMEHCAAEIARYIREKRLRNVVIVGHSFGAAVALKTELDHPASAAKLFLVDWGAVHPATLTISLEERLQQAAERRAATLQQSDDEFKKQMMAMPAGAIANAARVPVYAAMFGRMDRLASAQISYELRRYDWRARLAEITIPVAAVFGLPDGDEAAAARQQAQDVLRGISKLHVNFLPQTGHWVMEERPQEFDRLLQEFLSTAGQL
jgi:pimeloyl-ACP methyl ester carboxylesterase